jgi:hypothetical protein
MHQNDAGGPSESSAARRTHNAQNAENNACVGSRTHACMVCRHTSANVANAALEPSQNTAIAEPSPKDARKTNACKVSRLHNRQAVHYCSCRTKTRTNLLTYPT